MSATSQRYYFSSAGFICDLETSSRLARLRDVEGWRDRGAAICEQLNEALPEDVSGILADWRSQLEPT